MLEPAPRVGANILDSSVNPNPRQQVTADTRQYHNLSPVTWAGNNSIKQLMQILAMFDVCLQQGGIILHLIGSAIGQADGTGGRIHR